MGFLIILLVELGLTYFLYDYINQNYRGMRKAGFMWYAIGVLLFGYYTLLWLIIKFFAYKSVIRG